MTLTLRALRRPRPFWRLLIAPLLLIFLIVGAAAARPVADVPVNGQVVDGTGSGIPGVTVLQKGTANGTQTDSEGRFTITVPTEATLTFSFIGYATQEVAVGGRTLLNVTLAADTQTLNEVVVVGYGTQKKRDLTGAVARVEGKEIVDQPVQTPTQAMQGKVAGVQITNNATPNSQPIVRIRGTGTLLAGASPLYVVDGVQTTDIRNLSNADIASIDVLKDASAAAIYGVRGANGVIIITTKQGQLGKPVLTYSGTEGFREVGHRVQMADAGQYTRYLTDTAPNVKLPATTSNTDWYDQILRRGTYRNHNLAVSGATDNVRYYFSGNYLQDDGLAVNNKFSRLTVRSNTAFTVSKFLTINSQASFSHGNTQDVNFGTAYADSYRAAPIIPGRVNGLYGNTSAFGNVGNPILDLNNVDNRSLENRLQGNIGVNLTLLEGLTFRSALNVDLSYNNRRIYNYQFLNDENTFITAGGNQRNNQSSLSVEQNNGYRYLWENTATYQHVFAEKHNLTLLAGTVTEQGGSEGLAGSRRNVSADENQWYLNTGDPNTSTNSAPNIGKDRRLSYLGRINYAFADKYLLTTNLRYDGTSRFGSDNRWGFFPSLGLGWVLSEEGFMKEQKLVEFLKLRASVGQLGNDQIDPNAYIVTADSNIPYFFGGQPVLGAVISQIKDRNVSWETTTEYDAALEFGSMNNRLTGEFTYYHKLTKDALIPVNIPALLGDPDNQYITNAADIRNRGVEAALSWRDNLGSDWTYNFGANATFNQNRIQNLNGGQALVGGPNGITLSDNGVAAGSYYVLQAIGVYQNQAEIDASPKSTYGTPQPGDLKYQDTNGDGVIDANDRVFAGAYQPPVYYGINGGLTYKGVDFSFVFSGNLNNELYNYKKQARFASTDNVEASFAQDRWTPTNPSQSTPRALMASMPNSTYFIEKGAYLRLNNVVLGYTVPVDFVQKARISSVRIYLSGQNLFTATKYSGFTPELPGGPLDAGIENTTYPTARTLTVGLNAKF